MKNYTRKLSTTLLILLTLVAIFIVLSQFLTQVFIQRQKDYVKVTDISDIQERLTQNITKQALIALFAKDSLQFVTKQDNLQKDIKKWVKTNNTLIKQTGKKFNKSHHKNFKSSIDSLIHSNFIQKDSLNTLTTSIQSYEKDFLKFLDIIIKEYENNSLQQTYNLRIIILSSSLIILLSFLFVGLFIFNPATKNIKKLVKTIQKNNKKLQFQNEVLQETQEVLEDRMEQSQIAERNLKKNVEELKTTQEYLKKNRYDLSVALARNVAITKALDKSATVSISNLKGDIVKVNEIFCEVSGYTEEELINQNHRLLNSGYHPRSFWKDMWRIIGIGETWRAEVCNRAKDGSLYWVDTVINPIRDEKGRISQYLSIRYLITERKQHEAELHRAYGLLEKTSKAASIGTWELNVETQTVIWSNVTKEIYEVPRDFEPSLETSIQFYKTPALQNQVRDLLDFSMKKHRQIDKELEIITANGNQKWLRFIAIPIVREKKCVRIYGLFQDIQSQKESEKEIKKLALIAEKTDNLVVITNQIQDIEWVNESFYKTTGYNSLGVRNKNLMTLLEERGTSKKYIKNLEIGLAEQKPFSIEFLTYTIENNPYWLEVNITPILDKENKLKQYVFLGKDVTERKQAEAEIRIKNEEIILKNKKVARNIETLLSFSELRAILEGDWNTVAKELTSATVESLDISACELWHYQYLEKQFFCMGNYGNTFFPQVLKTQENNLFSKILKREKLLIINDLASDTQLSLEEKKPFLLQNIQSFIIYPVILSSNQRGLLICYQEKKYRWENEDIVFLKSMITELELVDQAYKRERIKEKIKKQHQKIKEINKDLNASINYASRIQNSILPKMEEIYTTLPECFVFFRARDVVSGDFYFYTQRNYKTIIAAVDCTGHGIPGAFMSLIGNDLLHDIINVHNVTKPHRILTLLKQEIIRTLRQEDGRNQDGMDLAVCVIDHYPKEFYEQLGVPHLEYAGAGNPLIYFQDGELNRIKPDKIIIGGFNNYLQGEEFTLHRIPLDKPTTFYIFSDGIQDQFGGPQKRKFSPRRLRNLLTEVHQKEMAEQKNILEKELNEWMIEEKQIDDMLLIGAKVG